MLRTSETTNKKKTNLQNEGHGIPALQTMLSIGLGQDQQFTLILQTLQQLRDVYGDSVDKIIQGNASIVFLKSTDDSMLDTLVKLSGQTHESLIESKTITRDNERILNKNEGRISYTMSTKERPVISFNDLLFIPPRNSVVLRAGVSPVWNRNETVLAMSYALLGNTIRDPRKKYSLQTVPTLSLAKDFDVRQNQPNFYAMLDKRLEQAKMVDTVRTTYMSVYDYTEHHMDQLDPDVLSDDLMNAINDFLYKSDHNQEVWRDSGFNSEDEYIQAQVAAEELAERRGQDLVESSVPNNELLDEVDKLKQDVLKNEIKIYAKGLLSKSMFVNQAGQLSGELYRVLSEAYQDTEQYFKNDTKFRYNKDTGELYSDQNEVFIRSLTGLNSDEIDELDAASRDANSKINGMDENSDRTLKYEVTDAFVKWLVSLDSWSDIAGGRFDAAVASTYNRKIQID